MGLIKPGAGIIKSSSIALLTSIAILNTTEYISKLKTRYTKLKDWIHVITLLYERKLKQSLVDKKIDERKAVELKKINSLHINKRKKIMKNTVLKLKMVLVML